MNSLFKLHFFNICCVFLKYLEHSIFRTQKYKPKTYLLLTLLTNSLNRNTYKYHLLNTLLLIPVATYRSGAFIVFEACLCRKYQFYRRLPSNQRPVNQSKLLRSLQPRNILIKAYVKGVLLLCGICRLERSRDESTVSS